MGCNRVLAPVGEAPPRQALTHVLEPEVPWDNIVAFVEAVEGFGIL